MDGFEFVRHFLLFASFFCLRGTLILSAVLRCLFSVLICVFLLALGPGSMSSRYIHVYPAMASI